MRSFYNPATGELLIYMSKKKPVYPGVCVFSKSAYATMGQGLVATMLAGPDKLYLMSLTKPAKMGKGWKEENLGEESVVLEFTTEAGVDVLMDQLKQIKKGFKKPVRKKK